MPRQGVENPPHPAHDILTHFSPASAGPFLWPPQLWRLTSTLLNSRNQRKPKVTLPVRTRRHWILLNKMGQQIIWETLANACDPGELEHPQHSQHPPQHPLLTDGRVYRRLHPALSDSNA